MAAVTIEIDEDLLAVVSEAASHSNLSVGEWFAQFAVAEKERQQGWHDLLAEIDALRASDPTLDDGWDELLKSRHADLGIDVPREPF